MMGFHDLMNFVRDLTAEMEADFIPTSEGLAEILVGTHLERKVSTSNSLIKVYLTISVRGYRILNMATITNTSLY